MPKVKVPRSTICEECRTIFHHYENVTTRCPHCFGPIEQFEAPPPTKKHAELERV